MFFFCWKLLVDAAESFSFFFQLLRPEDVLWMPLCIVLALSQMILIISWLVGKNCGLVDSQFPIFHRWFEWLFISPNPLITLYEKRNKVCSGKHIFVHISSSSNRFEESKDQDSTCIDEVSGMITTFDYVAIVLQGPRPKKGSVAERPNGPVTKKTRT